jgi:hypothetical protein
VPDSPPRPPGAPPLLPSPTAWSAGGPSAADVVRLEGLLRERAPSHAASSRPSSARAPSSVGDASDYLEVPPPPSHPRAGRSSGRCFADSVVPAEEPPGIHHQGCCVSSTLPCARPHPAPRGRGGGGATSCLLLPACLCNGIKTRECALPWSRAKIAEPLGAGGLCCIGGACGGQRCGDRGITGGSQFYRQRGRRHVCAGGGGLPGAAAEDATAAAVRRNHQREGRPGAFARTIAVGRFVGGCEAGGRWRREKGGLVQPLLAVQLLHGWFHVWAVGGRGEGTLARVILGFLVSGSSEVSAFCFRLCW